jgi:hypothetical protein
MLRVVISCSGLISKIQQLLYTAAAVMFKTALCYSTDRSEKLVTFMFRAIKNNGNEEKRNTTLGRRIELGVLGGSAVLYAS